MCGVMGLSRFRLGNQENEEQDTLGALSVTVARLRLGRAPRVRAPRKCAESLQRGRILSDGRCGLDSKNFTSQQSPGTPLQNMITKTALGAEAGPVACPDSGEILQRLQAANYEIAAIETSTDAVDLFEWRPRFPVCVLFGHENGWAEPGRGGSGRHSHPDSGPASESGCECSPLPPRPGSAQPSVSCPNKTHTGNRGRHSKRSTACVLVSIAAIS